MNKVILIGRLTADPVAGDSPDHPRVFFTIACDNQYSKNSKQATTFIPCVAWNNLATFAINYLHKGSLICIEGRINRYSYVSKQTNQNQVGFNVVCDQINFMNFGSQNINENKQNNNSNNSEPMVDVNEVFPFPAPTTNLENNTEQKQNDAHFSETDDLEWFDNMQENNENK